MAHPGCSGWESSNYFKSEKTLTLLFRSKEATDKRLRNPLGDRVPRAISAEMMSFESFDRRLRAQYGRIAEPLDMVS